MNSVNLFLFGTQLFSWDEAISKEEFDGKNDFEKVLTGREFTSHWLCISPWGSIHHTSGHIVTEKQKPQQQMGRAGWMMGKAVLAHLLSILSQNKNYESWDWERVREQEQEGCRESGRGGQGVVRPGEDWVGGRGRGRERERGRDLLKILYSLMVYFIKHVLRQHLLVVICQGKDEFCVLYLMKCSD